MKIVAAIVARSASPASPDHLLPQRSLAIVGGRHVLERIKSGLDRSRCLTDIVAAVGDAGQDGEIAGLAREMGLAVYEGHPDSVLDRLHLVARETGADQVVRVNGNFPLIDPHALDELVEAHLVAEADFSLNSHYHGILYGLGAEVFSAACLERAAAAGFSDRRKRAGSLALLQHPDQYKVHLHRAERTAPHLRVSVDFEPDLDVISEILSEVKSPDNESIIEFLESRPDLVAAQQARVPAEVSLEKALLFPEKMRALRRNNCVTFDTTYPISVELSLTNRCNHACVWCSDQGLRERLGGEFTYDRLMGLFAELRSGGARGIVVEGGGEPTLHPDFNRVVRGARDMKLAVGLITNGYLVPYLDQVDQFEWIRVSLDAASRNQYRRLKGVNGFDRVIANLTALAAERRSATLGVGYVVTNGNDDPVRLEQLVLFLRQIGVSYIHFRPVVDHPEMVSTTDLGFLKKYETESFSINIAAMTENKDMGNSGLPCLAHSLSTVITADGSVFLCGRLNAFESWEALGNLNDHSFHRIWTGEKRRAQVSLVSQADFCRNNCPQCRMTKYNRLLTDVDKIKTVNFI